MKLRNLQRHTLDPTPAVLLVDNYDSFSFNLWQLLRRLGADVTVHRNDDPALFPALTGARGVVLSPGPAGPADAGLSPDVVSRSMLPVLGVCLGHQVVAAHYGCTVRRSCAPRHGERERIHHEGDTLFADIPTPFDAARYNSLTVDEATLPASLVVIARSSRGEVMALRHRTEPRVGVQFHPESVLSDFGARLLANWLDSLPPAASRTTNEPALHSLAGA